MRITAARAVNTASSGIVFIWFIVALTVLLSEQAMYYTVTIVLYVLSTFIILSVYYKAIYCISFDNN